MMQAHLNENYKECQTVINTTHDQHGSKGIHCSN